MPSSRYPDTEHMERFYERVQERVSALPGVAAVTISHEVPAFYFPSGTQVCCTGPDPASSGQRTGRPDQRRHAGYFNTVGTRLIHGRDFTLADRSDSPRVIIINETMARTLFPERCGRTTPRQFRRAAAGLDGSGRRRSGTCGS